MKKSEFTPPYIQKAIDAKERLLRARALAGGEKSVVAQADVFYEGKSTNQSINYDRMEINNFMELL